MAASPVVMPTKPAFSGGERNRPYVRRWGTFTPYLQVLNVYNQCNVLFYFFNYDKTPPTRSGISMFPLLPSIGVEASF